MTAEIVLRDGTKIPRIGLGTWNITDREVMKSVILAGYRYGYRLIDTAAAYGNEISIGKAIASAGIRREDLFLSDKVWNTSRGYAEVQEACKRSLKKLKTEYLDLYLIHWPASMKLYPDWAKINAETWRGLEKLYQDGFVKTIGVCNFKVHHLKELFKTARMMPFVNQIECHPGYYQEEVLSFCQDYDIAVEASSPLGNGQILTNDVLENIGKKYNRSIAQICIRWIIQKGLIAIPKSVNSKRLQENINVFDFVLSEEDMNLIDHIPFCGGLGIDPDEVTEFG